MVASPFLRTEQTATSDLDPHPLASERLLERQGGLRLDNGEYSRAMLQHGYPAAEPQIHLPQFQGDHPAADHDQGVGERFEEERAAAGQVIDLGQSGNVYEAGEPAGGDEEPLSA